MALLLSRKKLRPKLTTAWKLKPKMAFMTASRAYSERAGKRKGIQTANSDENLALRLLEFSILAPGYLLYF
jgi:hypothetical protein